MKLVERETGRTTVQSVAILLEKQTSFFPGLNYYNHTAISQELFGRCCWQFVGRNLIGFFLKYAVCFGRIWLVSYSLVFSMKLKSYTDITARIFCLRAKHSTRWAERILQSCHCGVIIVRLIYWGVDTSLRYQTRTSFNLEFINILLFNIKYALSSRSPRILNFTQGLKILAAGNLNSPSVDRENFLLYRTSDLLTRRLMALFP